jgi:hypothetical protein
MRAGAIHVTKESKQKQKQRKEREQEVVRQLRGAAEDFIFLSSSPNAREKVF